MTVFDPVLGSQRVFRCLLQASAQPGKLFTLPPYDVGLLESVARTLLDHEVTFCTAGAEAQELQEHLETTTGARSAPAHEADFALIPAGPEGGSVAGELKRGTLEQPELGATAIYAVEELSTTGTLNLRLTGPGISGERTLGVEGLATSEVEAIRESRAAYPLGVDVYLLDGAGRMAGLPRSTNLEVV